MHDRQIFFYHLLRPLSHQALPRGQASMHASAPQLEASWAPSAAVTMPLCTRVTDSVDVHCPAGVWQLVRLLLDHLGCDVRYMSNKFDAGFVDIIVVVWFVPRLSCVITRGRVVAKQCAVGSRRVAGRDLASDYLVGKVINTELQRFIRSCGEHAFKVSDRPYFDRQLVVELAFALCRARSAKSVTWN